MDEWILYRVVTHEIGRGQSYYEICEHWTLDELDDWNCVIDAYEDVQLRQQKEAERAHSKQA